tara:strand:+ start:685 stop:897 length:213 start_codon:yes stop_codon:yes gene_type:complete
MKENIDKIIDDLINHEISKSTAKALLFGLHDVSGSNFIFDNVVEIDPEDSNLKTQLGIKLVDGHLSYDVD